MKNLLNFVRIFRELLENHTHLPWGDSPSPLGEGAFGLG